MVNGVSDEACLGLSKYPVPWSTVVNCLKGIGNKPIEKNNAFLMSKKALLSKRQVKYIEDIIVTRDRSNLGMSRKEMIQEKLEIGQASSYVQAENLLN